MSDISMLESAIRKKAREELNERLAVIREDWNLLFPRVKGETHAEDYREAAAASGSTIATSCFGDVFPDSVGVKWGHRSPKAMAEEYIQILMYAFEIWTVEPSAWKDKMLTTLQQKIVDKMMQGQQLEQKSVTIRGNFTVEEDVDCTESCSLNEGECPHGMECEGHDDE